MESLRLAIESPWRLTLEIKMYLIKPLMNMWLLLLRVKAGERNKFYGFPIFQKWGGSSILIGNDFVCRSWIDSNPLGINHPCVISTRSSNAVIKIGNKVGISGGSITAATSIVIGDNTLIGANCMIFDTDFHPVGSVKRLESPESGKSLPVKIGSNVFVGTSSIIMKGVSIGDNSIVAAGSVVTRSIPKDSIYIAGKIKKNVKS